ncbi:MBL fold metallo-hydrolase [bacterium]|nr:MBL fold metallo-hydrolase [bacterium]MCI0679994.1 MBL fold metallo-hydrolase [bacterium]
MQSARNHIRLVALFALIIGNGLIWHAVIQAEKTEMTVAFLDVGQGDAIFIESPSGNQMLIDGGKGTAVLKELGNVMPFYDRSIDVVIATHPDEDHIGGFPEVFERFDIASFFEPGIAGETGAAEALVSSVQSENAQAYEVRRGDRINLGGGAYIDILFPDHDPRGLETNDASIVARLTYGDTSFLFTGDSPEKIERYLLGIDHDSLDSDVLKVGHHGSKTSSDEAFLAAVSPDYAIISAGKDNRYGHPHKEVIDALAALSIPVLGTYEEGTIIMESDGANIRLRQ